MAFPRLPKPYCSNLETDKNKMINRLFALSRPLLFAIPPEEAHELTLKSLEKGVYPADSTANPPSLTVTMAGIKFANPIGIAAGFDKDARVPDAVLGMGCGFAEVGTVTPLAQAGNPKPRVFRLVDDGALINRLGFNNGGHAAALMRLMARTKTGIVGVNIGANKDTVDRVADYVAGIDAFQDVASYFMVNISSPNTTGLRKLQDPASLDVLLARVMEARALGVSRGRPCPPIFVKLAPDISDDEIAPICGQLVAHKVDGIAVSNTTLSRPGLRGPLSREGGGLSGVPLFHRSTVMLARVHQATQGQIPLIGIGGIDSGATALAKIEAGASLVQLYTGLIYQGPGVIGKIKSALATAVAAANVASVADLVGTKSAQWAVKPFEV
jgi:dihydroorotate dehydrogenase